MATPHADGSTTLAPARATISRAQTLTYNALVAYTRKHGFPPTVRELADIVGVASTSTVSARLKALEGAGWISRQANSGRAITIVGG